jgi:hypothetical protein
MKVYNHFRKQAQNTYGVAVGTYAHSARFEDVISGWSYIDAYLRGTINGLIMAEVASVEEIRACYQYIEIVKKAYRRNYINKHLPAGK